MDAWEQVMRIAQESVTRSGAGVTYHTKGMMRYLTRLI